MGGIFTLGECIAEDIRGEKDPYNAAIGGCAAGLVAGIKSRFIMLYCIGHIYNIYRNFKILIVYDYYYYFFNSSLYC